MKPKLTIVIPAKNEEKYIEYVLKSLMNQEFKDFEVLFIVPKNDPTRKYIINFFKKCKPFFNWKILADPGKGPGEARNIGIYHAKGEYILFLDADTFLPKKLVKNMIDYLETKDRCTCLPIILPTLNLRKLIHKVTMAIWSLFYVFTFISFNQGKTSTTLCLMVKKKYTTNVKFKYSWFFEDMVYTYELYKRSQKKNGLVLSVVFTYPRRELGNYKLYYFFKKTLPTFTKKVYYFYNKRKLKNDYNALKKHYPDIR